MSMRPMPSLALLQAVCKKRRAHPNAGFCSLPAYLGTAGTFALLSKAGIADVFASSVKGDLEPAPVAREALLRTRDLSVQPAAPFSRRVGAVGGMEVSRDTFAQKGSRAELDRLRGAALLHETISHILHGHSRTFDLDAVGGSK
jgi:hypothetical protein